MGSTEDNDVTISTSSPSSRVVVIHQQHQKKSVSSDRLSPSAQVQASEDGVGDPSLAGNVLLRGPHTSAAEGDAASFT